MVRTLRDCLKEEFARTKKEDEPALEEKDVTFDQKTRSVSVKGIKIAWLDRQSEVAWTGAGLAMLSDESQNMVMDVASSVR